MTLREEVDRVVAMLDDLYRRQPGACIPSNDIVRRAQEERLSPDMMFIFNRERLDEECYTREDLADQLNRMIADRGQSEEIGRIA